MAKKQPSVDDFILELASPQTELIHAVRELIKSASPELREGIKWNAPSYSLDGNDIITFNFRTFASLSLIFHTGPKGKDTHTGIHLFELDPSLERWVADKRLVLELPDATFLASHGEAISSLVQTWVDHARGGFST